MPFHADSQYGFGPLKAQLANPHNLNNWPGNKSPHHNRSAPFQLRSGGQNAHRPFHPLHMSVKPVRESILSSRHSLTHRNGLERADSVGDDGGSSSADSDEADVAEINFHTFRPASHSHHRAKNLTGFTPILRKFLTSQLESSKKRVKFADDLGLNLEEIFFFVDDFEFWDPLPLEKSDKEDLVVEVSEWQVNFSQPAADYLGFRKKLDSSNVGLENVIIKKNSSSFMGTIKVKNVSFRKDIFVRCTFNKWDTFVDYPAKFCVNAAANSDMYDTFSFEIKIPQEAEERHSIEFCVGFRTGGEEFWDSNSGRNYQLITSAMKGKRFSERHQDAYEISHIDSKFASWQQLENVRPYW